jgi:hypothetical protein
MKGSAWRTVRAAAGWRPRALVAFLLGVFCLGVRIGEALQWEGRGTTGPTPRAEYGFAFDTGRDVAVLLGGSSDLTFAAVNRETWEWNGSAWSLVNQAGPRGRCDNAMAFDSNRGVVVSFGGYRGTYLSDTWEWNGTAWDSVELAGPSARADAFMVFDSARGVMVLFGGQPPVGPILGDTWEYDGKAWAQQATTGPPARWIQRMAYDSDRGVTVMFGGAAPGGLLSDTWEWDGTAWDSVEVAGPSARYGHAMAYDPARHVTILFGGQTGFNFAVGPLGDTWEYDGAAWTRLAVAGPRDRTFVKIVYDDARQSMVLFGGHDGQSMLGDTWELATQHPTGVGESGRAIDEPFAPTLGQNAPNPLRDRTVIPFRLPEGAPARLTVFDAQGSLVRRLLDGRQAPGEHAAVWDGRDHRGREVPSGVYVCALVVRGFEVTRRMVVVR